MRLKYLVAGAAAAALTVSLAACGGGSNGSSGSSGGNGGGSSNTGSSGPQASGGTLSVLAGTMPDSLDPDYGYTTQAVEGDSMVYIPLLTYAAKEGTAGSALVPGVATSLPQVSSDGKTYTFQLRSGLKYSDGTAVKASDVGYAIERSIKLPWGGSPFFTQYIAGAADYGSGKAKSISGIQADDSTGKIVFHLTQPYGAFENLLAFEASAPIPSTTPMKPLTANPPVGVGPYKFKSVNPSSGYVLVKNPLFKSFGITDVPNGFVDEVDVTKESNTETEAQDVLDNKADIFDPGDTIPGGLLTQIQSQASSRYAKTPTSLMYYFFLNTKTAPFNNLQVRKAVNMALDRTALARISSGELTPGGYFLPPSMPGHPSTTYPLADVNSVPSAATIAKAKAMIKAAGMAGTKVTVWSETRQPRQQYCVYWESLLKQLGFDASIKVLNDTTYFQTIGNLKNNPQTGFADWSQDFPNPSDYYLLLDAHSIQQTNNENFGQVDDPQIQAKLKTLEAIPSTQLASNASGWESLEQYVANQAYVAVMGYGTAPKFTSDRVDFSQAVFNPVSYMMFNTVSLTK